MDILVVELIELERKKKDDEEEAVYFGLHKERTANVYAKWKIIEEDIKVDDEESYNIIMKSVEESAPDLLAADFKYNANRHRYLERHMRNFIGALEIPTYSTMTYYNFYDTLDCLIKRMF